MSGEETALCLAQDIARSGASMIEMIDFFEQRNLEGPVLETLFSVCEFSLSTLIALKLVNCKNASGSIPASICECLMLKTLDLQGCGFSGALSVRVLEPVLSGFVLCLACTAFQFFGTLPLFALPLLLLLATVSFSIRWVNGLSRLVGVASDGFSLG